MGRRRAPFTSPYTGPYRLNGNAAGMQRAGFSRGCVLLCGVVMTILRGASDAFIARGGRAPLLGEF